MSKLYVFGIGGTGARVIRSMMMLAASGVEFKTDSIVPVIVDPDIANEDLSRTISLIKRYNDIRDYLRYDNKTIKNRFFKTEIKDVMDGYHFHLNNTRDVRFKDYIGHNSMGKENMSLASILFSIDNLDADMEVGFKGNPNIGSVVLNQFEGSVDFEKFASDFTPGDRIFIISSIFGGTGASGFPLLVKTFRGITNRHSNAAAIASAPIGAITVMPYFKVKPDPDSKIDSDTFISKTKAALHYYDKNVYGDQSAVNVMYSIGDIGDNQYDNHEGGRDQVNDAHIVEFASALAIADFLNYDSTHKSMNVAEDANQNIYYAPDVLFKEFGIEDDVPTVLLQHLAEKTNMCIRKAMTQFVLLSRYVKSHLSDAVSQPWANDNKIDKAFLVADFTNNINLFTDEYLGWLSEMAGNNRAFKPYTLDVPDSNLYSIVNGVSPSSIKALWAFGKGGCDLFDSALNNEHKKGLPEDFSCEQKFIDMFYEASRVIVEGKYKF